MNLPAEPLRLAVDQAIERTAGVFYGGPTRANHCEATAAPFLTLYEQATKKSARTGWRRLQLLRTSRYIPAHVADELCLTIGVHPCQVWGARW